MEPSPTPSPSPLDFIEWEAEEDHRSNISSSSSVQRLMDQQLSDIEDNGSYVSLNYSPAVSPEPVQQNLESPVALPGLEEVQLSESGSPLPSPEPIDNVNHPRKRDVTFYHNGEIFEGWYNSPSCSSTSSTTDSASSSSNQRTPLKRPHVIEDNIADPPKPAKMIRPIPTTTDEEYVNMVKDCFPQSPSIVKITRYIDI